MKRAIFGVLLGAFTGCTAHTQINATTGDSQQKLTLTATPFTDAIVPPPCTSTGTGLGTVRITTSAAWAALTLITFGVVQMVEVEYSCAPQTGSVPAPIPNPG